MHTSTATLMATFVAPVDGRRLYLNRTRTDTHVHIWRRRLRSLIQTAPSLYRYRRVFIQQT